MIRRRLLQHAATASAALHLNRLASWAQTADFPGSHRPTLRAIAAIVLPASQGTAFLDRQTERFLEWVKSYRAGADMEHGYGFTRIQRTAAHPAPRYGQELDAIEVAARKLHGKGFSQLDPAAQRALVQQVIADAGVAALPSSPGGAHVVIDLMAHYFRGSEANDLCFEAQIGRESCNGFSGVGQPPKPLKLKGGA